MNAEGDEWWVDEARWKFRRGARRTERKAEKERSKIEREGRMKGREWDQWKIKLNEGWDFDDEVLWKSG